MIFKRIGNGRPYPDHGRESTRQWADVAPRPVRLDQLVTTKGQLDLERHGGHTGNGVAVRVLQRILALTAVIWHNDQIGAPVKRSLIPYDH